MLAILPAFSQDLEPRRWSHLPVGSNSGNWSTELSTTANFHTNNDDFFGGKKLKEDVYLTGQGHLIAMVMNYSSSRPRGKEAKEMLDRRFKI